MRIYKIAIKKEANFLDWLGGNSLEEEATGFAKEYLSKRGRLPTIGEIMSFMMENKGSSLEQDTLKTLAVSVLSSLKNNLVGA